MNEMLIAEREQVDIDQTLDHFEQQQKGLIAMLEVFEKMVEEISSVQGGSLGVPVAGPADTERDRK